MTDLQIWEWTLTKEAIAPCFVRDVLAMRQSTDRDTDFFWLGHTPCRTVFLVGMVVSIQVYDKRAIYTIDDGTAVIDCVLRHPTPPVLAPAPRSPNLPIAGSNTKTNPQRPSPKKPRLDKAKFESAEPPPPITEPGYPVCVVGRVMRHFQSKQIHADMIDPCPSSLDEITHLERVIELHKTKYSRTVPFVPPPKLAPRAASLNSPTVYTEIDPDANIFLDMSLPSHPGPSVPAYTLPAPPGMLAPLQNRSRQPLISTHARSAYPGLTHIPSSPGASSIASSTPSSPCKPPSPAKAREISHRPKLRHPSRLHTHDLTANTFRLYVKHYMDNAPPPFPIFCSAPSRSTCDGITTPTKYGRNEAEDDEPTPRPRLITENVSRDGGEGGGEFGPTLGFTLSHLRRVPELALLAARVVRAETRKRNKADREKERTNHRIPSSTSAEQAKLSGRGTGAPADPPRKKMSRLFSWAIVKLYEEGSIVLWDGDVRPLPVPPPPLSLPLSELRSNGAQSIALEPPSASCCTAPIQSDPSTSTSSSASVLYASSASAPLYSHYRPPRRPPIRKRHTDESSKRDADVVDADADPGCLSDPPLDEEAYVPLTPQFLAEHVKEAVGALRRGRGNMGVNGRSKGSRRATGREPTPTDILAYMQRTDGRWARVGVWVVEETLAVLKAG